jgi:Rieske Fe-S protein
MPENDDDLTLSTHTPRRTVLRGILALGAAGVLTGCGGSSSNNEAAQAPATGDAAATTPPASTPVPTAKAKAKKPAKPKATAKPTSEAKATSEPKATTKPKAAEKPVAKPKGTDLGASSAVPVGGGKIYEDQKIVVTQPKKGQFKAFSAVCTHQDCILADCDGGKINCGCHASSFDLTTGVPEGGPATVPLPKKTVTVSGDKVYVS